MSIEAPQSQSLSDWLFYLEQQHPTEIDLGLARVQEVAERANVIDLKAKKTVLVAGTNGKGTTIRFMEMALLKLGFRVGVFSSPHLFHYNERVRINGNPLPNEAHVESFQYIEQHRQHTSLTYFEFSTLSAYRLFQQAELDFVLIEVGLGGRLDSTNIVQQDLSIITSIDLDHTDWLGETREEIGFEKAGIFKPGNTAIIGEPNPPSTIVQQAKTHQIKELLFVKKDFDFDLDTNGCWSFSGQQDFSELSRGFVPLTNMSVAITALLKLDVKLDRELINHVIADFNLPGRMQFLNQSKSQLVDVAHNPHAVSYLAETLTSRQPEIGYKKINAVVAMMKDKDIKATLSNIAHLINNWHVADLPNNPRAAKSHDILTILQSMGITNITAHSNVEEAWKVAEKEQEKEALLLGFGSFYTVGEILQSQKLLNEV